MGLSFKSYIGNKDVKFWDGIVRTFTRLTSTGGSLTLNSIGNEVDVLEVYGNGTDYTSTTILTAIGEIGTNTCTMVLQPGIWVMTADITIPSNIGLRIPHGATISKTSGTLNINGPFSAGLYQVFSGFSEGDVTGLKEARPVWFGAVGDGTTVCTTAIQSAFDSGASLVVMEEGTFLSGPLTISSKLALQASTGTSIKSNASGTLLTITADQVKIEGSLELDGNSSTGTIGLYYTGANNGQFDNLNIHNFSSHNLSIKGVTGNGSYYTQWRNLVSKNSGGSGVKIDGDVNPDNRANVHQFFGGQISANGSHGFELENVAGIGVFGVSVEQNTGYAYHLVTCGLSGQSLTVMGGWVEGNGGGVDIDATTQGVQFYGTRWNAAGVNEFTGAGINNPGNVFFVDNATGALTKWLEISGVALRGSYLRNAVTDPFQVAGSNTIQSKASGDVNYRFQLLNNGGMYWGSGSATSDVNMTRSAGANLQSSKGFQATTGYLESRATVTSTAGAIALTASACQFHVTLSENVTGITFPTAQAGKLITISFTQGGAGSYTVVGWPGTVLLAGGAYTATATLGKTDVLTFQYDDVLSKWLERSRSQNL